MSLANRTALLVGLALAACSGTEIPGVGKIPDRVEGLGRGDGLDPQKLPEDVRGDYAVFAQRCSKCHALARALDSGIDDDAYWQRYVARMRLQPSSGISPADEVVILRFLHFYSLEIRRRKAAAAERGEAPASDTRPPP